MTAALFASSSLRDELLGGPLLRAQVEARLTSLAGPGRTVRVGRMDVGLGELGYANIALADVSVNRSDAASISLDEVALRVRLLPLVRRRLEVRQIRARGASVDLGELNREETVDAYDAIASIDLEPTFRALHGTISDLESMLRERGIDTLTLADVRFGNVDRLGLRSETARLTNLTVERDASYTEGLSARGSLYLGGSEVRIAAGWSSPEGEGRARTLSARLMGFDTGELPRLLTKGVTPFQIAAPLDLSLNLPFDAEGAPRHGLVSADLGDGSVWFGDLAATHLNGIQVRLRVDPVANSFAVLPTRFASAPVNGTVVGGIALRDRELDFEFATLRLTSRAGGVRRPEVGGWSVSGRLDLAKRHLELEQFRFVGDGGGLEGDGTIDLTSWTPGLRFDVRTQALKIETLKAYWPPYIAHPLRRWLVSGGVRDGTLRNATLSTDIKPGTLAKLRDGGTFGPDELLATLPIEGAMLRTVGDLPPIEDASGTLHVVGVSVAGTLTSGRATSEGREVDLTRSRLSVADFTVRGLPARLHIAAKGEAAAMARIAATKPLSIAQKIGIKASTVRGRATLVADASMPLIVRGGAKPTDWSAKLVVRGGALTQPFSGHRIAAADLTIEAGPGEARIDGIATVDGNRTRLALVEPLGGTRKGGSRQVALRLDRTARERMGIQLDDVLRGPVDVRLLSLADGWQRLNVDLTRAVIDLPFLGWRKGTGIAGRATFELRKVGGQTKLRNVRLEGDGFAASGTVILDHSGLRSADLTGVRLAGGRGLKVRARRARGGYRIDVDGKSYDARSMLAVLTESDKPSKEKGKAKGMAAATYSIAANIAEVVGFGGQVARDAKVALRLKGGDVDTMRIDARVGNGTLAVRRAPKGRDRTLNVDAADAGAVLRFSNLYTRARRGRLAVRLVQEGSIYRGDVRLRDFTVVDEPKLMALLAKTDADGTGRRKPARKAKVKEARVFLRKGPNTLAIERGSMRGGDMAATFEGTVYDARGRAAMKGTFLPAYGLNRVVSSIPFVGLAAGNGRKSGLLGITFRLKGPWRQPKLTVNPLSLFAPGVFRKIFE